MACGALAKVRARSRFFTRRLLCIFPTFDPNELSCLHRRVPSRYPCVRVRKPRTYPRSPTPRISKAIPVRNRHLRIPQPRRGPPTMLRREDPNARFARTRTVGNQSSHVCGEISGRADKLIFTSLFGKLLVFLKRGPDRRWRPLTNLDRRVCKHARRTTRWRARGSHSVSVSPPCSLLPPISTFYADRRSHCPHTPLLHRAAWRNFFADFLRSFSSEPVDDSWKAVTGPSERPKGPEGGDHRSASKTGADKSSL